MRNRVSSAQPSRRKPVRVGTAATRGGSVHTLTPGFSIPDAGLVHRHLRQRSAAAGPFSCRHVVGPQPAGSSLSTRLGKGEGQSPQHGKEPRRPYGKYWKPLLPCLPRPQLDAAPVHVGPLRPRGAGPPLGCTDTTVNASTTLNDTTRDDATHDTLPTPTTTHDQR